jgi:hypothetical protein
MFPAERVSRPPLTEFQTAALYRVAATPFSRHLSKITQESFVFVVRPNPKPEVTAIVEGFRFRREKQIRGYFVSS